MSFEKPLALWLILLVVPAILLWLRTSSLFRGFQATRQYKAFVYGSSLPSWLRRNVAFSIRLAALALVAAGLSHPFILVPSKNVKYKNIRLFFLTDVSLSMAYGEDIAPNRLAAAKSEVEEAYERLEGSYETSLIPFAGQPNVYYCPPTYSRRTFSLYLREMSPSSAPELGTNILAAIEALDKQEVKPGVNLVILLSDGGKDDSATVDREKLFALVRKLVDKGFKFYAVGIGKRTASPVVIRDSKGDFVDYYKDEDGKTYYSELDEDILRQIAAHGNGEYMRYESGGALHPFISKSVKESSVIDAEEKVSRKLFLEPYCFFLASSLLLLSWLANKAR